MSHPEHGNQGRCQRKKKKKIEIIRPCRSRNAKFVTVRRSRVNYIAEM